MKRSVIQGVNSLVTRIFLLFSYKTWIPLRFIQATSVLLGLQLDDVNTYLRASRWVQRAQRKRARWTTRSGYLYFYKPHRTTFGIHYWYQARDHSNRALCDESYMQPFLKCSIITRWAMFFASFILLTPFLINSQQVVCKIKEYLYCVQRSVNDGRSSPTRRSI
jgi:hypothetical protein